MPENIVDRLNAALEGRYRVEEELGEGGMATVFLAEDLRHDRKVALKVLKPELAAVVGAERFLAEIKTTANLQHPHILPLFDSGEADSFLFYVMPYVEGESLRQKLDREKQLGVNEAIDIAEKVASALQYAHEQDIVHRDVKPANILMSRGEPLVADFGIALALSEAGGGRITETGLSLGTPHYMSPEQASGDQSLDKRSDVYALGCILYEMLTGEPPYGGPTAQSVLAKILTGDARRITELRRTVPMNVDAAVAKALEKLPADRFASAEDFVRALSDESFRHVSPSREAARAGRRTGGGADVLVGRWRQAGAIVASIALGLLAGYLLRPGPASEPVFMASVQLPEDQAMVDVPFGSPMAFSADGATLVYAGPAPAQGWQLWVRRADALQASPLPGTGNAFTPVISPDGDAVAFIQGTDLKVVGIGTGTSRTLGDDAGAIADWTDDGFLYFLAASSNRYYRIAAGGGEEEQVPGLSSEGLVSSAAPLYTYGDVLPDGKTGVWTRMTVSANAEERAIVVVDLAAGEYREIARGTWPRYLKSGHLVWVSPEGTLLAARFDPGKGELEGPPIPVAEGVATDASGAFAGGISENGGLVYRTGGALSGSMRLAWFDQAGDSASVDPDWELLPTSQGNWSGVALSPSGDRLVTTDGTGGGSQLWVKDVEKDAPPYRITFDGSFHVRPRWMTDGKEVSFISNLGGEDRPTEVWARAADGSGSARRLAAGDVEIEEAQVSPDGKWLVYRRGGTTVGRDIYAMRLGQDSVGQPLIATDADEKSPQLSPDGRWLAYTSNETGQLEVFVRPFPDVSGGKWQVSLGGGFSPLWAHSGDALFYVGAQEASLIAADLDIGPSSVAVVSRETLFPITDQYVDQNYTAFDVSPDDQRFLMFSFGSGETGSLVWVRNWLTEWRRRAGEGM